MRNFHKMADGINVAPLLHSVVRHPELWNVNQFRTTFPGTPHVDVDDIMLRFSATEKCDTTTNVIGDNSPVWHPAAAVLPEAKPLILDLARAVGAFELGRVIISRVRPGGRILPHADRDGDYVNSKDRARYHMVLQGLPGSLYHCGGETVCMQTGSVWWFNAHEIHSIENNSVDDRIHMLIDFTLWPTGV